MKEVIQEAAKLSKEGEPCVLATVVRTKGFHSPKGGRHAVGAPGWFGCRHLGRGLRRGRHLVSLRRKSLRQHGGPEFKDYFLNEDIAARDGLVCGGSMYFFLEPIRNPRTSRHRRRVDGSL